MQQVPDARGIGAEHARRRLPRERADQVTNLLLAELDRQPQPRWSEPLLNPAWKQPDPAWLQKIEAAHGFWAERFAFCQTMPLEEFLAVAEGLRPSGYRPIRFRPFVNDKRMRVAAAWTRDGQEWQLAHGQPDKVGAQVLGFYSRAELIERQNFGLGDQIFARPGPTLQPTELPAAAAKTKALADLVGEIQGGRYPQR